MKKLLLLLSTLLLSSSLSAYTDSDLDGVDDTQDRCPNTPFIDLVDINGCTKESLGSEQHFDIIIGGSYSDADYQTLNKTDTYSGTLQVDYYYKNFSIQASTAYFSTEGSGYSDSGMYDSFVGASYQFNPLKSLSLRVGGGAILPTYETTLNNNKTDYTASANLSYRLADVNLFAGYAYTMINDDDTITDTNATVNYQNTNAYSVGVGFYPTKKLYVSGSYNASNSIYIGVKDIETTSAYMYYSIDSHWFTTLSYAYGISDTASKNYASVRLGYFF